MTPNNSCGSYSQEKAVVTLWEIDIYPAPGQPDVAGRALVSEAADLGLGRVSARSARGFLVQGELDDKQIQRLARELFADTAVEQPVVARVGDAALATPPTGFPQLVHVLPKPGVTDQVAESAQRAVADFGLNVEAIRTFRKYWLAELPESQLQRLAGKLLANESIEQIIHGPLKLDRLAVGSQYQFSLVVLPVRDLSDHELVKLSKERTLSLTLVEMQTIQRHYRELGREPTDAELETIAQTWSEHCSHKTLAGRVIYQDERGEHRFQNMLKETIFAATQRIRKELGEKDWCVSVFKDNAGIVTFDDEHHIAFKVETHNRPSAIEPYGGANTGVGGVIRDTLGTGLGAKPICNTDVFCFAPPDTPADRLPPGVLHPRRVMRGVVSGVRDYGNRMGIPTVNGAIYFDPRYIGNPLVFCGNVGLIPQDKAFKEPQPNDLIVALGGRTGRDGIHGATFSSVELTSQSEKVSSGAVQIGNAITEKMVLDVLLTARDEGLYHAVTDCGAGGFSSAVGEMGEKIGAEVWLEKAPLKYDGLSYTEVWISEAQERMVLAVPESAWTRLEALCRSENVEATVIGRFAPTGKLKLMYHGEQVGELSMQFLHDGRPPVERSAIYKPEEIKPLALPPDIDYPQTLLKLLSSLNIASKEWVIRQYDHEVQGGSVLKPLVGVGNDGPGDAAVLRPVLDSRRGIVVACGMNPRYGDFDPYDMAASAIDEAIRNCVAVGADPAKIAVLDNFCWGYTDRPETLGSLVRAALGCYDTAVAFGTPFISGKDSLNNEFSYEGPDGKTTISIPPTLLISALGQVADVANCVSMDLKKAGNALYLVGLTKNELGGSHLNLVLGLKGGRAPAVDLETAKQTFAALHQAISKGLVRACHDLSEGGLAVAAAEMAFAGGLGARIRLEHVPCDAVHNKVPPEYAPVLLFSESNSRFLCEVPRAKAEAFERLFAGLPHAAIGEVIDTGRLQVLGLPHTHGEPAATIIDSDLAELKSAWQAPLKWS
jgi:phosphoribosylformylglycinamidine synthase